MAATAQGIDALGRGHDRIAMRTEEIARERI
jgi:hypothetical protein